MGFGDAVASATRYANNPQPYYLHHFHTLCNILKSIYNKGGSVAEWLACWIQAQKGLGSNRSRQVYNSHHLQADCQESGSAPEPYAR